MATVKTGNVRETTSLTVIIVALNIRNKFTSKNRREFVNKDDARYLENFYFGKSLFYYVKAIVSSSVTLLVCKLQILFRLFILMQERDISHGWCLRTLLGAYLLALRFFFFFAGLPLFAFSSLSFLAITGSLGIIMGGGCPGSASAI